MFRVVNDYLARVNLIANSEIETRIDSFLKDCKMVTNYSRSINFNRYQVDIKIKDFSLETAENFFNEFNAGVAYPYSELHVRFNEGKCVRYKFITSKENKDGFYVDVCIS